MGWWERDGVGWGWEGEGGVGWGEVGLRGMVGWSFKMSKFDQILTF